MLSRDATVTVALDAMGGDGAPREPVRAAALLSRETNIKLLLVGQPDLIKGELDRVDHNLGSIEIVPAASAIGMAEKPSVAIGEKPDASILVAAQAVASGDADALVSAGSTGALVLSAARHIPRIPGVRRAALAAVYPTNERSFSNDRFSLILDVGATIRCEPEDLLFFAYMGHAYASRISKVPSPSVGLLNIGSEESKGDEVLTRAYQLLRDDPRLNFIGNVEGTDIPKGIADVIVCEGLVGNVVLKLAEGMGDVLTSLGAWAFKKSFMWRIGLRLLSQGLKELKTLTDYREYGGAPFLGFRRMVIKAHGRSHARAIGNAVKVAAKAVRGGVCQQIEESVTEFEQRSGRAP